MGKARLEAFSDRVIAIVITTMVLELRVPHGADLAALAPLVPVFLSYVLSFVYVGIYWANHHHFLHAAQHVNGRVLWANLHLLFWLSLFPFCTAWMGRSHAAQVLQLQSQINIKHQHKQQRRVTMAHDFSASRSASWP